MTESILFCDVIIVLVVCAEKSCIFILNNKEFFLISLKLNSNKPKERTHISHLMCTIDKKNFCSIIASTAQI